MKHAKNIDRYTWTIHELAEDIWDLDYDSLAELFSILSQKFSKDAVHDLELWHPKVAKHLENISEWLAKILEEDIQPLADLCRKYNEKGIK
jgi:hypothetical protein